MKKGILIIHFGDVAGYPPVIHAIPLIAASGLPVHVLACRSASNYVPKFPDGFPARLTLINAMPAGWRKLIHWLSFISRAAALALWQRPKWVYASDSQALPAALIARFLGGSRLLYQEHDSPDIVSEKAPLHRRFVSWLRLRTLRRADLVVMPNAERLRIAREQAGSGRGRDLVIWNVAPLRELQSKRNDASGNTLLIHFHGSMSECRIPIALIDALAKVPNAIFQFASYEFGGRVHTTALLARAKALGISERVIDLGSIEERDALIAATRRADIGLTFLSNNPNNVNHYHATGASNKVFDYMSAGLALLLSKSEQWASYVPEYGLAVDSNDPDSIASSLRLWLEKTYDPREQGERGRQKIAAEWHFERIYQPLLQALTEQNR